MSVTIKARRVWLRHYLNFFFFGLVFAAGLGVGAAAWAGEPPAKYHAGEYADRTVEVKRVRAAVALSHSIKLPPKPEPVVQQSAPRVQVPPSTAAPVRVDPQAWHEQCKGWAREAGVGEADLDNAMWLIGKESGCRVDADNPSSDAYGIPQALPGSKMASAGADWQSNPVTQIRWMVSYVNGRYGGWAGAVAHSRSHGWY